MVELKKFDSRDDREFARLVQSLPKLVGNSSPFDLLFIRQKGNPQTLRYLFSVNLMHFLKNQNLVNKIKVYVYGFDRLLWNQQFPMAVETIMTILHYKNQVVDQRFGVITHGKISANLLEASMLREGLFKYVDKNLDNKYRKSLNAFISRVIIVVDAGQWLQSEMNGYKQWRDNEIKPLNLNDIIDSHYQSQMGAAIETILTELKTLMPDFVADKENYLKNYLTRIYLTNSFLGVHFF